MIRRSFLFFSLTLLLTIPGFAAGGLCDAISGNLVVNCGFEDGNLTGWTQGGNTGFTSPTVLSQYVHSGNWGLMIGPVGSDGTLTQVISDAPGTVSFDFWLENDGGSPSDFTVLWDGVAVNTTDTPLNNSPGFGFTEQGPVTLSSTSSDTLEFVFRQDKNFFGLDDISVVQLTTTPEPGSILLLITVVGLCGMAFRKRASRNAA